MVVLGCNWKEKKTKGNHTICIHAYWTDIYMYIYIIPVLLSKMLTLESVSIT